METGDQGIDKDTIDCFKSLQGFIKWSKIIIKTKTAKHNELVDNMLIKNNREAVATYGKVLKRIESMEDKRQKSGQKSKLAEDLEKHHRKDFVYIYDKNKIQFLGLPEHDQFLLERDISIVYGMARESEGGTINRKKKVEIPLSYIYTKAKILQSEVEAMDNNDPKYEESQEALNYPDAILYYFFKIVSTSIAFNKRSGEMESINGTIKTLEKRLGLSSEKAGGFGDLLGIAQEIFQDLGIGMPAGMDFDNLEIPDKGEMRQAFKGFLGEGDTKRRVVDMFKQVEGAKGIEDIFGIVKQGFGDGEFKNAISKQFGTTAKELNSSKTANDIIKQNMLSALELSDNSNDDSNDDTSTSITFSSNSSNGSSGMVQLDNSRIPDILKSPSTKGKKVMKTNLNYLEEVEE